MARPKMTDEQKAEAAAKRQAAQVVEEAQPIPPLADYIQAHERDGIVLVRVSYPGAEPQVFQGKFSGVIVTDGPLSRQYADGSTE
jgi:hypothetical protein